MQPVRTKWLTLGLLQLSLVLLFQLQPDPLVRLEHALQDWLIRNMQPSVKQADTRVMLVDIDDTSLQQAGRWPWPRTLVAELLERLQQQRPALIGIDILLPEQTEEDDRLGRALTVSNITTSMVWSAANLPSQGRFPAMANCTGACSALPSAQSWISNTPELSASEQAHISPVTDLDGVVRRVYPLICHQTHCVETLALSLARQLFGTVPAYTLKARANQWQLGSSDALLQLPLQADTSVLIPWYSQGAGAIPWVSAAKVLNNELPPDFLAGKILILGSSAVGLHDRISVPIMADFPAVEAHALLLQSILDQTPWYSPEYSKAIAWTFALLISACSSLLLIKRRQFAAFSLMLIMLAGWQAFSHHALKAGQLWPQLPVIALPLATLSLLLPWIMLDALRARDILQRQFRHYVAPQVMSRIQQQPDRIIGAEPERCVMTVLFADLRNFSTFAEGTDPEQLAEMLQHIMDRLTRVIHRHGGTVDKYIGDAIMAFWGAPMADHDHAAHGIAAAQALCREMALISAEPGMPALQLSVGINSGVVVVGEFGSSHRRSYTLLGAPVNLAAHLEGATRKTDFPILVGSGTHALMPHYDWPDAIQLKLSSREHPVTAWPLHANESPAA